jgi:hypothetical protein
VFTNDDFPSSPVPPPPENAAALASPSANGSTSPSSAASASSSNSDWVASKARIEVFLKKTENLTEQQYAARTLGPDLAQVQFPRRSSWQTTLYAEHQKYVADAKLCISGRVSDQGRRQDAACYRLDDKESVHSLRESGKESAQEWKSRQEAVAPR